MFPFHRQLTLSDENVSIMFMRSFTQGNAAEPALLGAARAHSYTRCRARMSRVPDLIVAIFAYSCCHEYRNGRIGRIRNYELGNAFNKQARCLSSCGCDAEKERSDQDTGVAISMEELGAPNSDSCVAQKANKPTER